MRLVMRFLRKLLGLPTPQVTSEQALRIALDEMARMGQNLRGNSLPNPRSPTAKEGLKVWTVCLDTDSLPQRLVEIDNQTGKVMKYFSPPR